MRLRLLDTQALTSSRLAFSAFTFWEVAMLANRQRVTLDVGADEWRDEVLRFGIAELPVTGSIGISAVTLKEFHPDPADRIIAAIALDADAALMTSDRKILAWPGPLARHDAHSQGRTKPSGKARPVVARLTSAPGGPR